MEARQPTARDPEGTREDKKRRTRDAIAATALDLFLARGYESTTVRQIAEAAGTSPRTFFRYFPSKEDVVFGDLDAYGDDLDARLADRPQDESPLDSLCEVTVGVAAAIEASPEWREIVLGRMRLAEVTPLVRSRQLESVGRWAERLAARLAARAGRRRARMDDLALAHAATAILHHAGRAWATANGSGRLASRVREGFVELRQTVEREGVRGRASGR